MREDESAPKVSTNSSDFVRIISEAVFKSLPRSDQRRWAQVYLQGLVETQGKRTIRNIAGDWKSPLEQSLQQFISKSPWEWSPVRQELANLLESNVHRSVAWVVQPLVIEKAGSHSVGVARQFVEQLGRTANCQQAVGIWLVSERAAFPVEWSLMLPPPWTTESGLRHRARATDAVRPLTPVQAALRSLEQMVGKWPIAVRPIIMDLHEVEPFETVSSLSEMGVPFVLRVKENLPISLGAEARRHLDSRSLTAGSLVRLLRAQQRPVAWNCPIENRRVTTPLVAQDVLIQLAGTDLVQLQMVGSWPEGGTDPQPELWLSNMVRTPPAQVFRLARLSHRVTRDFEDFCEPSGIRDFSGRSFRGWHHHATLVAAAHAVAILTKWADESAAMGLAPPRAPRSVPQSAGDFVSPLSDRPQWLAAT